MTLAQPEELEKYLWAGLRLAVNHNPGMVNTDIFSDLPILEGCNCVTETGFKGNPLTLLTAKQREVLDLLIDHKTSKEISRVLGISPHTVDQRIMLARHKLDLSSRSEIAKEYRKLVAIYERSTYEETHISPPLMPFNKGIRNEHETLLTLIDPDRIELDDQVKGQAAYRVVPELFDGNRGILIRLLVIGGITVMLVFIILGGMAIFSQASTMMRE